MVNITPLAAVPRKETWYPLSRTPGYGRLGKDKNFICPAGIPTPYRPAPSLVSTPTMLARIPLYSLHIKLITKQISTQINVKVTASQTFYGTTVTCLILQQNVA
jgi:hypothetical protein